MVGYTRHNPFDRNREPQLKGITMSKRSGGCISVNRLKHSMFPYMIKSLREGETLVVQSMDRIAGNMGDLRQLLRTLTSRGVRVKFLKEDLTFTGEDSPMAIQLLLVMDAMADFERSLRRERQQEGIARAKAKGLYKGRKKSLTPEQVTELKERLAAGESKADLARSFNIGRVTLYRYAKIA